MYENWIDSWSIEARQFHLLFLNVTHTQEISRLNDLVLSDVEARQFYVPLGHDSIVDCLESNGFGIGVFSYTKMIGYRLVRYAEKVRNSLVTDLSLSEYNAKDFTQLSGFAVHPSYRGLGIGSKLFLTSLKTIEQKGFRYVVGTCHPDNHRSLKIFRKYGFSILATKERYGQLKHILFKELFHAL